MMKTVTQGPERGALQSLRAHSTQQHGLTMVELLIGISVIGGLLLLVLAGYTTYTERKNVNDFLSNSIDLATGVRRAFREVERSYINVTTDAVVKGRIPPDIMLVGNTIVNPWGGLFQIVPVDLGGGTKNGFTMTSNLIPQSSCMSSARMFGRSFLALSINGRVVMNARNAITDESITEGCSSIENNVMVFTYQ